MIRDKNPIIAPVDTIDNCRGSILKKSKDFRCDSNSWIGL